MAGSSIDVIAELLGHADLKMAKRYQHLSPEFLLKAVSGLDRVFQSIDDTSLSFGFEDSTPGLVN